MNKNLKNLKKKHEFLEENVVKGLRMCYIIKKIEDY